MGTAQNGASPLVGDKTGHVSLKLAPADFSKTVAPEPGLDPEDGRAELAAASDSDTVK